jgi:hypothetical protein
MNVIKYILKLQAFTSLILLKPLLMKYLIQEEKVLIMNLNYLINNSLSFNQNNQECK